MTAQLANGGYKIYPRITVDKNQENVQKIKYKMLYELEKTKIKKDKSFIEVTEELLNTKTKKYTPLFNKQENVKFVLDAMFKSTNELYGTSYSSRIDNIKYQFAGKTGTAQVKRITKAERELDLKLEQIPYKERDHAWYIAFGPYRDPRYAVSVLVEHGGSGGKNAAPLAKKLFKLIIDRHDVREKIRQQGLEKV